MSTEDKPKSLQALKRKSSTPAAFQTPPNVKDRQLLGDSPPTVSKKTRVKKSSVKVKSNDRGIESSVAFNVALDANLKARLRVAAAIAGVSMGEYVRKLIEKKLDGEDLPL